MKKNILITGVSSGIGYFLAKNLSDESNIYGVSRNLPADLIANFDSLDLTNFKNLDKYIEKIRNIDFDTIILNAGSGYFDKFENITDSQILEMFNLNILSNIFLLKKLLPYLNKNSKIIFIGSVASKKFMKNGAVYQASKFALRGLAGSLRNEISQKVFLINPRLIKTNFFKNSNIEMDFTKNENFLDEILSIVNNILAGNEKRFEVDL